MYIHNSLFINEFDVIDSDNLNYENKTSVHMLHTIVR